MRYIVRRIGENLYDERAPEAFIEDAWLDVDTIVTVEPWSATPITGRVLEIAVFDSWPPAETPRPA